MALYENGILISGANTLPQMTLAEYQALPVSERPTYWERTDGSYSPLPASQVSYKNGSVEDALDDLNGSVKVKILTYSVTTGNANTHYFNNGTANIAKGQVALSSHADYPSTAVGAVAVSARSSSGYSVALPAIESDTYVVAYGSTNMTVNVSVLVFYT